MKEDDLQMETSLINYLKESKSVVEEKFKIYKSELIDAKERLKKEIFEKLYKLQLQNNEIESKQQSLANEKNSKEGSEETRILKDQLDEIMNQIEKLEIYSDKLKDSKLNDILSIKEDRIELKSISKTEEIQEEKYNYAARQRDMCINCFRRMEFKAHYYYTSCTSGLNNCTGNTLYECTFCKRGYCTNCAYPPNIAFCGCGNQLVFDSSPFHSCDLCRASLTGQYRRCALHDYDVCNNCYNSKKII